jgi:hypothetical protein
MVSRLFKFYSHKLMTVHVSFKIIDNHASTLLLLWLVLNVRVVIAASVVTILLHRPKQHLFFMLSRSLFNILLRNGVLVCEIGKFRRSSYILNVSVISIPPICHCLSDL